MPSELLTLPQAPAPDVLEALLAPEQTVRIEVRRGLDAQGRERVQLTLHHADPEVVATARQALLERCQRARIRAFVV